MIESKMDIAALIADLRREHEELEGRLSALTRRSHLSVAEEAEATRLKKLKLAKKDRLAALCRSAPA